MDYTALNTAIAGIPAEASPTLGTILTVIASFAVIGVIIRHVKKV